MRYFCVVLALAAATSFTGCGNHDPAVAPASEPRQVAARVETAAVDTAQSVRDAVGTVRPVASTAIQSKSIGYVRSVHVTAGQTVEAGALLAEIDPREADAMLKAAEAALGSSQRSLEEIDQSAAALQSSYESAEADRVLAETTLARQKNLYDQKAVSKQAFDEADAAAKSAVAQANARRSELAALQAKREQVLAGIRQSEASLESARVGMSYTRVVAPFAGLIAAKNVDVGDLASPGMTLFTLDDTRNFRLETNVDESEAAGIKIGDVAPVLIDTLGSDAIEGKVSEIVPAADPASRTFVVKLDLAATDGLRSGQFGRARFSGIEDASITVPETAVVRRGQLEGVFALGEDNIARLRLIKTGKSAGDRVEVLSGLSQGDRYVAEVTPEIADGIRVTAQ